MKNFAFWTLIAVNAVLLVGLGSRLVKSDAALAQSGAGAVATGRDDFLMVPGEIVSGNNAIVYVVDETTHQLSSMAYDDNNRRLTTMAPRDINRDFDAMGEQNGGGARRGR